QGCLYRADMLQQECEALLVDFPDQEKELRELSTWIAGHIINIGSTAGSWPYAGGNVYGATKAFVRQFSLNLRTDLHGTAVRVTDIEPGLVGGTEFSNVRFKGDDGKAEKTYQNTVALTPEDVSEAVWWVSTLPAHVNINTLEMMPVTQSYAGLNVHRQ
ncbi:SDR family NAD(P)-dependent oxidoreductase, partial [Escherichia coli]